MEYIGRQATFPLDLRSLRIFPLLDPGPRPTRVDE
jgi:hypothetical protein